MGLPMILIGVVTVIDVASVGSSLADDNINKQRKNSAHYQKDTGFDVLNHILSPVWFSWVCFLVICDAFSKLSGHFEF
jgi:hypothetical protein